MADTPYEEIVEWMRRVELVDIGMIDPDEAITWLENQMTETGSSYMANYDELSGDMVQAIESVIQDAHDVLDDAGVSAGLYWHPSGYYRVGYAIEGVGSGYGWDRMNEYLLDATGVDLSWMSPYSDSPF